MRQSVIREFGYKRLIKLVPADLLYPKLTVYTSGSQTVRRDALVRRLKFRRGSPSHSVQNYTQIGKERKILMQKLQLYNLSRHAVFDIESRSGYPNAGNELFPPAHSLRIRIFSIIT